MAATMASADKKFKLMMLGDAGVGKTSIARRFVDQEFLTSYIHTIGIDFLEKVVQTDDGQRIKLQIWDTAGQDRFRTLIRPYYRGAAGMALVYDVTDAKTFHNIEEGEQLAAKHRIDFFEVSAKEGRGIDDAFMRLTELVVRAQKNDRLNRLNRFRASPDEDDNDDDDDVIVLNEIPVNMKRERKCCNLK